MKLIIDTPPSTTALARNAVAAADVVIGVAEPDAPALLGAAEVMNICNQMRHFVDVDPVFLGVVWNRVPGGRERQVDSAVYEQTAEAGVPQFDTKVFQWEPYRQSRVLGQTIAEYAPGSRADQLIVTLVDEILARSAAAGVSLPVADRSVAVDLRDSQPVGEGVASE